MIQKILNIISVYIDLPITSYDENTVTGTLVRNPDRNEFLTDINEQLIVEFYNR